MTDAIRRHLGLVVIIAFVGAGPASAADKVVVGYLFGEPRKVDFRLYTHLCHAFLTLDGEGNIKGDRNVPDPALTAEAHRAGVKVLVSLGGWGFDEQFRSVVSRPEAEDRYVRGVLKVVEDSGYDGVDLDWEYPDSKAEVAGFERLARRFRKDLDAAGARAGRPMFVTMASSSNPGTLRWLDPAFLVETMDWVNVMTYDYAGDWGDSAGHNAPLFDSSRQPKAARLSAESTMRYLLDVRRLPADKLALGIPLYGRAFAVKEPYASTRGVAKSRVPAGRYRDIERLLREKHWTRVRDDETGVPWLTAPDGSAVIGYDDAESVALKAGWARDHALRGVFFWQVDGDRMADGSNPLQESAREAFFGRAGLGIEKPRNSGGGSR